MALLAILQPDPLSLARLASALGDQHQLVLSDDWASLLEALRSKPVDGCVLELYHSARALGLADVEHLRNLHPGLAIVVYADFRGREMDLFALGRLQVDGVVPAGRQESLRQIRDTVAQALTLSLASRVLDAVGDSFPPDARDCLRWAVENAHDNPSVRDLASTFFRPPRSLARSLRAGHSPTAGQLLLWGKLFRATQMLGERGASVERVAFVLGYSSRAALSRAMRRATGFSPKEVMRRGGWACVLEGLLKRATRAAASRRKQRWSTPAATRFPRSS